MTTFTLSITIELAPRGAIHARFSPSDEFKALDIRAQHAVLMKAAHELLDEARSRALGAFLAGAARPRVR